MLESVGGVGRCGPPADSGFWILESGLSEGRRVCGLPPADSAFWILETGLSDGRSTGVGRPDSVFCILEVGVSRVAQGARILYSAFCILPATCACDAYAWEQGWHMSGCWILDSGNWAVGGTTGVWAARILYSVFCILPAAYACDAYAHA